MRKSGRSTRGFRGGGTGSRFGGVVGLAWFRRFGGDLFFGFLFLGDLLGVVFVDDARDIGASFAERGDASILFDPLGTGVVGGKSFYQVEVITLEKFAKIAASAGDIILG